LRIIAHAPEKRTGAGEHVSARSAVGMGSLAGNISVEIEVIFEIEP
jgi:enamine deaminase RidA (YjgF/YER057c/UK114 family)